MKGRRMRMQGVQAQWDPCSVFFERAEGELNLSHPSRVQTPFLTQPLSPGAVTLIFSCPSTPVSPP